jgi:glycosyltransferase involved in cell wall biosynthesis
LGRFFLLAQTGAGNAVIAQDNKFIRWVVGDGAVYFSGAEGFAQCLDRLEAEPQLLATLAQASADRYSDAFTWLHILEQYDVLLKQYLPQQIRYQKRSESRTFHEG